MTTTFATVRDQQLSVLAALTPSRHAHVPFVVHRGEVEFLAWVEANTQACWRRFEILHGFEVEKEGIGSGSQWGWLHNEQVLVAYPREFGRYGAANERDLDATIDADLAQIDKAIGADGGSLGNYVSGQHDCKLTGASVERRARDVILTCTFRLYYDRSY